MNLVRERCLHRVCVFELYACMCALLSWHAVSGHGIVYHSAFLTRDAARQASLLLVFYITKDWTDYITISFWIRG